RIARQHARCVFSLYFQCRAQASWLRLPREHDSTRFYWNTPKGLPHAGRPVGRGSGLGHRHELAPVAEPQKADPGDGGTGPLALAADDREGTPAERSSAVWPTAIDEAAGIVNKLNPAPRRHVAGRAGWIESRKRLGPVLRRAAVIFDNGRAFFLSVGPCA